MKKEKEPDIKPAIDRRESVSLMEPMLVSESSKHWGPLADLAVELSARAAGFRRSLHPKIQTALSTLVRSMNCYYSNLIEGHATHPIDIERALNNDYSSDPQKRSLQKEAKAHIDVQKWIDHGGLPSPAATVVAICEIHARFCEQLPEDLRWVNNPKSGESVRVEPGELRTQDVRVGRHVAISPGAVRNFLLRFEQAYHKLGKTQQIASIAAAHHRLLWIHPFLDGNGRVARLLSHAMLLETLDSGGVWSVARGLARRQADYKTHLGNCDLPRRSDLDGRGTLSEEALVSFTHFFLNLCIDQIDFMEHLIQPDRLRARINLWAKEDHAIGNLPAKAEVILEAILLHGELPRGQVPNLLGLSDRQARRVVASLVKQQVIVSKSSRAPLRISFPARLAGRWFPGLFPDAQTPNGV